MYLSIEAIPKHPRVNHRNELNMKSCTNSSFPIVPVMMSAIANPTIIMNDKKPINDFSFILLSSLNNDLKNFFILLILYKKLGCTVKYNPFRVINSWIEFELLVN